MTQQLILLRHGQSEWNKQNRFTGWVDVRLTEQGRSEARRAGLLLANANIFPDVLHTSVLSRAIQTAHLALSEADLLWLPVQRSWRLNERHYGALQGLDKGETLEKYGEEQFMAWRRSYDTPPPPLPDDSEFSQVNDRRYVGEGSNIPRAECLKDVLTRLMPYWRDTVLPQLRAGMTVLVVAHGNSLRALVKELEGISDADISGLNIPTGMPLVYRVVNGVPCGVGEYLDPDAAANAAARVALEGKE